MIAETKQLINRDDFAIVTVAIDKEETLPEAYRIIKKYKLKCPVVWHKQWQAPWGQRELSYDGVPSGFIIDPEGTIMPDIYAGEGIGKELSYLMDHVDRLPPVKLQWGPRAVQREYVKVSLTAYNPARTPVEVHLSAQKLIWMYGERIDGEWQHIEPIPPGKHPNANTLRGIDGFADTTKTLTFAESDTETVELTVPVDQDAYDIDICAKYLIPGTENYEETGRDGEKSQGIWMTKYERITVKRPDWYD